MARPDYNKMTIGEAQEAYDKKGITFNISDGIVTANVPTMDQSIRNELSDIKVDKQACCIYIPIHAIDGYTPTATSQYIHDVFEEYVYSGLIKNDEDMNDILGIRLRLDGKDVSAYVVTEKNGSYKSVFAEVPNTLKYTMEDIFQKKTHTRLELDEISDMKEDYPFLYDVMYSEEKEDSFEREDPEA